MHAHLALPNHSLPLISHFPNLILIFFQRFPLKFAYKGALHVYLPAQKGTIWAQSPNTNETSSHNEWPLRITSWTFRTILYFKYTKPTSSYNNLPKVTYIKAILNCWKDGYKKKNLLLILYYIFFFFFIFIILIILFSCFCYLPMLC